MNTALMEAVRHKVGPGDATALPKIWVKEGERPSLLLQTEQTTVCVKQNKHHTPLTYTTRWFPAI